MSENDATARAVNEHGHAGELAHVGDVDAARALAELANAGKLGASAADESAALARPMLDLVRETLESAARSTNTARVYRNAIGLFLQYLEDAQGGALPGTWPDAWRPLASPERVAHEGKRKGNAPTAWEFRGPAAALRLVGAGTLDGFRASREAAGDGPNAATTRVYAVRVFLRVALRAGVLTQEQGRALGLRPYVQRQKRDVQPTGRRLTPEEARRLMASASETASGNGPNKRARDSAILAVMLYAGLRRDEVARLALGNVTQDGGRYWLVLQGKGQKTRRVKVHDKLYHALATWATRAGLVLGEGAGPIFRAVNKGDVIGPGGINASVIGRLVAEYGARASLAPASGPNVLGAHDLRRTCARNAYDNGAPLLLVQTMLGHSDPATTARYIGVDDEDGNTAVDFVHY